VQGNLTLVPQVNNAPQAHIANCHYCEFDLHIEAYILSYRQSQGDSASGEALSAADMQYIPVMKHDAGWTDLRLRVVGIAALREIHPGEELLSCYFTSVHS
jgi:hypothetical protein